MTPKITGHTCLGSRAVAWNESNGQGDRVALKRKDKGPELEKVYRKQRDNTILKEFRGEAEFIFPTGPHYPEVLYLGDIGPYSESTLRKCIAEVGMNGHRAYLSPLWKHKTDRSPTHVELDALLAFVQMEIEVLRPKVVVPIGQQALSVFMEHECISGTHGNPYDWEKHWLIPIRRPPFYYTYKPSGMTEDQRDQLEDDLADFRYDLDTVAYYLRKHK